VQAEGFEKESALSATKNQFDKLTEQFENEKSLLEGRLDQERKKHKEVGRSRYICELTGL
jgi:hypothetical protein